MNVFSLRSTLVKDYERFARSFTTIRAQDIREQVDALYATGRYWPEPLLQVNPKFAAAQTLDELAAAGAVHRETARVFRFDDEGGTGTAGTSLKLHLHQAEALAFGQRGESFVVTTGTGSGKSLCFFLPIFDGILKAKEADSASRTQAIIIYPMNALANSQAEELQKFLRRLTPQPVTFARYTGQESDAERRRIADNPPDILLTNYMMLELLMTRQDELDRQVIANCQGLRYLVLDELHTYRGRQGADVAMLVRRVRERVAAPDLVCIGTSATMASEGTASEKNTTVSRVASKIFATPIPPTRVVQETLRRVTDERHNGVSIRPQLAAAIRGALPTAATDADLKVHPLAIWVENVLGLDDRPGERKVRARPLTLMEAVDRLAEDSGLPKAECGEALEKFLLLAAQGEVARTGRILVSERLGEVERRVLGVGGPLSGLSSAHHRFLRWHRVREGFALV